MKFNDIYYIDKHYGDHMLHLFAKEGDTYYVEVLYEDDDDLRFPCQHMNVKEIVNHYLTSTKAQWDAWVRKNAQTAIKEAESEIKRYKEILAKQEEK